jgi:hypothetical protein
MAKCKPASEGGVYVPFGLRSAQLKDLRVPIDQVGRRKPVLDETPDERGGGVQRIEFLPRLREQDPFVIDDEQSDVG